MPIPIAALAALTACPCEPAASADAAKSDAAQADGSHLDAARADVANGDAVSRDHASQDVVAGDAAAPDSGPLLQPDECAAMQPGWIFCSSFEEGSKAIWDDYDGNPDDTNLLLADPGPFSLANNHVMRLRAPQVGDSPSGADLVKVLPASHDRLYARWYVQWEPGYDFSARNHGSGLHAGSRDLLGTSGNRPNGDDWFTSWLEPDPASTTLYAYTYYRGMYQDCADPNGSCWGDHLPCTVDEGYYCEKPQHRETVMPSTLQSGRWYCVELLVDGGTPVASEALADGTIDWWIDGQEIGPWTDLWLRTSADLKLTILWLNLYHHGLHSVEGLLLDNVVVSTDRIGCR